MCKHTMMMMMVMNRAAVATCHARLSQRRTVQRPAEDPEVASLMVQALAPCKTHHYMHIVFMHMCTDVYTCMEHQCMHLGI